MVENSNSSSAAASSTSSPSSSSFTTADRVRIFVIVLLLLCIVLQNTVPTKDNININIFQQHTSSPSITDKDRKQQEQQQSEQRSAVSSPREKPLNISQSVLDKIPAFINSPKIESLLGEYDKVEIPEMTYNQYEIITEKTTADAKTKNKNDDEAVGKITFRKFIPLEAISFMRMESILKSMKNTKKEKNISSSPDSELLVNQEEARGKSKENNAEIISTISVASTFRSIFTRTNRSKSSPIIVEENPFTGDVTTSYPPLVYDEVKTAQFLAMVSDTPPGLGLTTQLLTYIDLIAAAQNVHFRTLIFPGNIRTNWFTLINMSATSFPGPSLTFVASNWTLAEVRKIQSQISSKKHVKWTREAAYLGPHALIHKIRKFYFKTRGIGIVKVPSMYKRYPFLVEPETNFGIMTCGLVFHSKIEEASLKLMDAMEQLVVKEKQYHQQNQQEQQRQVHFHPKTTRPKFPWFVAPSSSPLPYFIPKVRYISVHLRIEAQDSVAFRRPAPTPQQVENWFRTVITNLCKKHRTPHVFVASGPIDQNYTTVLKQKNKYRIDFSNREVVWMNVFSKDDLFEFTGGNFSQMKFEHNNNNNNNNNDNNHDYFNEEATPVIWERRTIYPTNTRAAAVDALILQHGVAAVLTAFSSLTPLIYSRRCYEGPRCLGKLYGKRGKYFVDDDDERKISTKTETKTKGRSSNYIYEVGHEGDLTKAKPYRCGLQMGQIIQGGGAEHPGFENELYSEGVRKDREKLFE